MRTQDTSTTSAPPTHTPQVNPVVSGGLEVQFPSQVQAASPTNPFARRSCEVWTPEPVVARKLDSPAESPDREIPPARSAPSPFRLHTPGGPRSPVGWQGIQAKAIGPELMEPEADAMAEPIMSQSVMTKPAPQVQPAEGAETEETETEIQPKLLGAAGTPMVQRQAEPAAGTAPNQAPATRREPFRLYAPDRPAPSTLPWWGIQTKVTIGQPNDVYEQEADRVAEQVMGMSSAATPTVQRQAEEEEPEEIQTKPLVQRQADLEEDEPIQAKCEDCEAEEPIQRLANGTAEAQPDLENRLNASQGGGSALPEEVRSFMEPRFGADFRQVRVHTGSNAVQMNKDLSAQAFTHKQDIYFGAGKSPGKNDLTAHELTHVVQQTGTVQQKPNGSQAEPVSSSVETKSQPVHSADSRDVEPIVNQIVNALQLDPNDQTGRIKQLVARLNPSTLQVVLTQVQTRLTPEQQQSLQAILAEPVPAQTELPPEPMAPNEGSNVEDQHQRNADPSQATEQKLPNQTPTESSKNSSQAASASGQERKPGSNASDTPENQQATSNQASSSRSGKNGASVATEPANSQQATIPKSGSRQGSAQKGTSTSHQGEGQAATAKTGSASSKGNTSLAHAGIQATSSEARSGSSSSVSQPSGQGVSRSSGVNPGRSGSQPSTVAQPLQSPEVQVPSARSQSTQALLEQVATTANSARQRFTERITQGTETIAASIQQQQAALTAAGEQQTGAIQALFANARAQVGEIVTSAQAQLQTDATSHLASLQQGHTATLGQVATTFSSGQERVQTLGNTYADRSLQTADESTQQVQIRIQGMSQEARAIGQEKAQVGGSTPEIAQAKARAANEIASDTATKITSGVSDAMRDLRATGPETARGFREQGQEAARQVGAGQAEVVNQLSTANQQTSAGIQQAVTQGSQALGNLSGQLTAQLASLEQTIQNQLQTEIAQKSQEIAAAGQQAITTFQEQGQQAIASGDEHLAQFNQQLAGMDIDPELAAEVTGEIVGQVNGAYDNLIATTDGAFQQADSALAQAGTEVMTAINGISTNAAGQIQTFLGQAQGQVTQQVGTISGQLGTTVTKANAAGSGMVSQVTTSLDGQLGQIDSAFGQGLGQYQGDLNEQVASAEGQAREPKESLPGRVEQGQQRVEQRAQRSWIENQWNDLVDMFSWELLAGLLVGLAVGIFIVATFGTGAVALVAAGAIAGAAGAIASTVVGNARAGRDLGENVIRNAIWGAFGGAVGAAVLVFLGGGFIAGGAIGGLAASLGLGTGGTIALLVVGASVTAGILTAVDNWRNDRPLDQGIVASVLLASILTLLGIKAARRPGNTTPVEEPPVRPPVEEPPVRPPVEEPPVRRPPQGCFVAGTKVLTPDGEKSIESLIVGNKVWALDTSSKEERVQLIEQSFIRNVPTVLDIQIGETTITCSPEHPFWVPQQGWLKAKELQVGSTLFSLRQGNVTVAHIQIHTGTFTVYNIEVNGLHNYCVSPLGILVHNKAMRWNLQDRAAALRGRINELIEQARGLPDEVPSKADLLRQAQELEPEASRLSRLAEESESPDALEPSRDAIESVEDRVASLEESVDIASLPSRARSLSHRVRQLIERARELPDTPEKYEILRRLEDLEQQAKAVKNLAEEQPNAVESLEPEILETEAELREFGERIRELNPDTPSAGTVPRPHLPYPQDHLPTGGDRPYVPPRQAGNPEVVRWPEGGGFEDIHGNKWEWARDQHAGPHWDVQHPDGSHTNVYPDGIVHQGSDNF